MVIYDLLMHPLLNHHHASQAPGSTVECRILGLDVHTQATAKERVANFTKRLSTSFVLLRKYIYKSVTDSIQLQWLIALAKERTKTVVAPVKGGQFTSYISHDQHTQANCKVKLHKLYSNAHIHPPVLTQGTLVDSLSVQAYIDTQAFATGEWCSGLPKAKPDSLLWHYLFP